MEKEKYLKKLCEFINKETKIEEIYELFFTEPQFREFLNKFDAIKINDSTLKYFNNRLSDYFLSLNWKFPVDQAKIELYSWLYLKQNNINIELKNQFDKDALFYYNLCPRYICNNGMEYFFSKILPKCPHNNKKDIKQWSGEQIKNFFQITDKKPVWIQDKEWPFAKDGKPMRFIKQTEEGDKVEYVFEDISNNTKEIIRDFY